MAQTLISRKFIWRVLKASRTIAVIFSSMVVLVQIAEHSIITPKVSSSGIPTPIAAAMISPGLLLQMAP